VQAILAVVRRASHIQPAEVSSPSSGVVNAIRKRAPTEVSSLNPEAQL